MIRFDSYSMLVVCIVAFAAVASADDARKSSGHAARFSASLALSTDPLAMIHSPQVQEDLEMSEKQVEAAMALTGSYSKKRIETSHAWERANRAAFQAVAAQEEGGKAIRSKEGQERLAKMRRESREKLHRDQHALRTSTVNKLMEDVLTAKQAARLQRQLLQNLEPKLKGRR